MINKGSRRVLLVSIDGLQPDAYLGDKYYAPTLKQLVAKGSFASSVKPVYPSVTFPNHTTIATGVKPLAHGITSNTKLSIERFCKEEWYWETSYIKVPTLWQAAKKAGKSVAILRWPVTVGCQADWVVPEIFSVDSYSEKSAWDITMQYADKTLIQAVIKEYGIPAVENRLAHDQFVAKTAVYLEKHHKPDLMMIHLIHLDHVHHHHSNDSLQVYEAVREMDLLIKELLEAIDPSETVLTVVGDHGFSDYSKILHINTLLTEEGWLKVEQGKIIDWDALAHIDGGQASIYLRDVSLKNRVLEKLKTEGKDLFTIISRHELDLLGALPKALCALEPAEGYSCGCGLLGPLTTNLLGPVGQHGYLPTRPGLNAGFISAGPGVPQNLNVGNISMLDIAPTIASILDIELGKVDGSSLPLAA